MVNGGGYRESGAQHCSGAFLGHLWGGLWHFVAEPRHAAMVLASIHETHDRNVTFYYIVQSVGASDSRIASVCAGDLSTGPICCSPLTGRVLCADSCCRANISY